MSSETLMTAAEFERIAHGLGPCELVRGEVVSLSCRYMSEALPLSRTAGFLGKWCGRTDFGRLLIDLGVSTRPDTVRDAGLAYYSYQRLPRTGIPQGFLATPPNLVVEVVGHRQGWPEMLRKTSEYLQMGVDRVWIVDPTSQRVHIYRADAEPTVLGADDNLTDQAILPGFSCKVAELFAD